jgi:Lysozyme inhibitor LprI
MFGPGFQPCGEKTSTLAVVECVQAKTNVADQRLNAAYKALQARIDALNVNHWRRNVFGSNTGTPIAAFTERRTGQSGRCRQPSVCAR